jgi:hypothetical protein
MINIFYASINKGHWRAWFTKAIVIEGNKVYTSKRVPFRTFVKQKSIKHNCLTNQIK